MVRERRAVHAGAVARNRIPLDAVARRKNRELSQRPVGQLCRRRERRVQRLGAKRKSFPNRDIGVSVRDAETDQSVQGCSPGGARGSRAETARRWGGVRKTSGSYRSRPALVPAIIRTKMPAPRFRPAGVTDKLWFCSANSARHRGLVCEGSLICAPVALLLDSRRQCCLLAGEPPRGHRVGLFPCRAIHGLQHHTAGVRGRGAPGVAGRRPVLVPEYDRRGCRVRARGPGQAHAVARAFDHALCSQRP